MLYNEIYITNIIKLTILSILLFYFIYSVYIQIDKEKLIKKQY